MRSLTAKIIIALLLLSVAMVGGCSENNQSAAGVSEEEDAQTMQLYVQSVLNLRYRGICTKEFMALSGYTEDQAKMIKMIEHTDFILNEAEKFSEYFGGITLSSEDQSRIYNIYERIYAQGIYSVGMPEKVSPGQWTCVFTSTPLELYYSMDDYCTNVVPDVYQKYLNEHAEIAELSEEEQLQDREQFYLQHCLDFLETYVTSMNVYEEIKTTIEINWNEEREQWSFSEESWDNLDECILSHSAEKP